MSSKYQFGPKIGAGGMADVFQGVHTGLQRPVALKIMKSSMAEDPRFVERFYREARVSARLQHPNIVLVYDVGEVEGRPLLEMELLEGETLRDRIRRGPLSEADAITVTENILRALAYAQETQGVVHRDIKPGNVFLCRDGAIKLMDFGIASAAAEAGLTGSAERFGTPDYMSPEQTKGRTDFRTDIYAVGIMLYEMLMGQPPFKADNVLAVMNMHVTEPAPPLPPRFSPAVRAVVANALQKNPDDRYPNARTMLAALVSRNPDSLRITQSSQDVGPVVAADKLKDLDREGAKRRTLIGVSGGICVLAVGGIIWSLMGNKTPDKPLTPGTPAPRASSAPVAHNGASPAAGKATPNAGKATPTVAKATPAAKPSVTMVKASVSAAKPAALSHVEVERPIINRQHPRPRASAAALRPHIRPNPDGGDTNSAKPRVERTVEKPKPPKKPEINENDILNNTGN